MISEVYDALKEAGASDDKARLDAKLTELKHEVGLLKWMLAASIALNVGILARLFTMH